MAEILPVVFEDGVVSLLDQTLLPAQETRIDCRTAADTAGAIKRLAVRGAPAIGVAAAYALAAEAQSAKDRSPLKLLDRLEGAGATLVAARPTAVNLAWAVGRVLGVARSLASSATSGAAGADAVRAAVVDEARALAAAEAAATEAIGAAGSVLMPGHGNVLTHCNTGPLATTGIGTALGVIKAASKAGKALHVWVDETRPLLQGSRLTAWELKKMGIPATVITDSMAAAMMARGEVDVAIVGADRIAANGDTANKIGTYSVAVAARYHRIPFYVAAPVSTVDLSMKTGEEIPIEERDESEVLEFAGVRVAPAKARAANPAFDVTPGRLVTAIVTDAGVCRPPYERSLAAAVADAAG